ncbi:RRD2 [Candida oxycetoniae]|uniref:Serine/threonine-protein phosphatase 2A activator n=1 Tax=Candida oxycetoniae TaxID=497107 RepID=A0AAI9SYB0_9ASCO|nr:RRD2 [Candida oxycetoniae]KAI3405201.1 RRD2 [Candida oxycetoniae]
MIVTQEDLQEWIESKGYNEVVEFICELQESVVGKDNSAGRETATTRVLEEMLDRVNEIIDRHRAESTGNSRFGKIEFRDFYKELEEKSQELVEDVRGKKGEEDEEEGRKSETRELAVYLQHSFGDANRIDYGSGHELNFICFLLCLKKIGVIERHEYTGIVLLVFTKYISVMRRLQKEYWLEPAGSHGVWGLDDYHFLPFLFGAAQLTGHEHMRPKSIHNAELVEMYRDKYMYFECIDFINRVTKMSLRWHSPMLDDISGAKSWQKIKEGMVKMYRKEVLEKLPIMQHFIFGQLIKEERKNRDNKDEDKKDEDKKDEDKKVDQDSKQSVAHLPHLPSHVHTWGDCCGIRIPSVLAQSNTESTAK